MDREKSKIGSKRGANKMKPTLFPSGDFIALGSKPSRSDVPETKAPTKSGTSAISERKRDGSSPSSSSTSIPNKKQKLSSSPGSVLAPPTRAGPQVKKETSGATVADTWDSVAADVDPSELLSKIIEAEEMCDDERKESLLCGSVKTLKNSRTKPEPSHFLTLMFLAKTRPNMFSSELIIEAFTSLLKRDVSVNYKSKGNNLISVLASNVLLAAFHDTANWPEEFVKTFVDDSLGERIWVDNEECKGFVNNILTAFNTVMPPKSMMAPELTFKPDACPSPPSLIPDDDDASSSSLSLECRESLENISVVQRFKNTRDQIERYILDMVQENLARRQPMEVSRNMLRLLISTCGLSEIRLLVSQKLEVWLQNPKLTRPAQDLLSAICMNCTQHTQQDVEVIAQLIRVRLKTKPIINHFLQCIKELIRRNPENLSTVLKHAIYNELSNSRNPNNMQVIAIVFQNSPKRGAEVLAEVFQDLLAKRDDYLRALRALLREIVRTIRHDLNCTVFCMGLMNERRGDAAFKELEAPLKERMLFAVVDLIVLAIFMAISPSVRDAASAYVRGDKKDLAVLRNYQHTVTVIQRDTIWWLHTIVPKMYSPARNEFVHCMHKVLFMEQMEHYYNKDNWPPENERIILVRLASEVPIMEDTLMRVLIIGLSRDHPLNAADALELADQLIKRAASIYNEDCPVLKMEKEELIDIIFNLCAYHHPENITLPIGYQAPNLAIADSYWKAWIMLLICVAHNPNTFGFNAWEQYQTLHNFMEMCVTNHFTFPPTTIASGEKADEIRGRELQIAQIEKQEILEFESHLAAASTKVAITESNSLLISKLVTMDPLGQARRPPTPVLEQVKILNQTLKLGHLLCRSRKPDFLLDIIQRQGTSQSMPWLAELVESNEGSFNMLPVQCLCEFLLNETPALFENGNNQDNNQEEDAKMEKLKAKKRVKPEQLLCHLQMLLRSNTNDDSQATREVLDYFLRRLSSQQISARNIAMKGLSMVLSQPNKSPISDNEEEESSVIKEGAEYAWLLKCMPSLPHFESVRGLASGALRQACLVENDPEAVSAFVKFLSLYAPMDNLQDISDLSLDMAQLIVERPTIINCIIPPPPATSSVLSPFLEAVATIFIKYLRSAKTPSGEAYAWSESQDQILVQWAGGEAATMHILVVHAMVIVLTYGPYAVDQSHFNELLQTWFPINTEPPQAFLVDTSEEALLLPDWLKLRMIRSTVAILVDAALKDLDPSQLVLFVQSFGIPVPNMGKLLMFLDLAVEVDSFSVDQAVVDKAYMAQLVEVQHQRGAKGGERFARLLGEFDNIDKGVALVPMDSANSTSVIQKTPRTFSKILSLVQIEGSKMLPALVQLFKLDDDLKEFSCTDQELFKGLQKALSQDIMQKSVDLPNIGSFTDACYQITRGAFREKFSKAVLQKTMYSSVLFRLSTSSVAKLKPERSLTTDKLLDVCRSICVCAKNMKSPLTTILKQFMKGFDDGCYDWAHKDHWRTLLEELLSSKSEWNPHLVNEILKSVKQCNKHRLEEATLEIVRASIQKGKVQDLVQSLAALVTTDAIQMQDVTHYHLFIDLIAQLEPEVVGQKKDLHRKELQSLLFGKKETASEKHDFSFRPYLLALLTHQASWETLQQCIALVLRKSKNDEIIAYDSSSVLDFLWACIHIPKIWQGKDKRKPKHYQDKDMLVLNEEQLVAVANYIVFEAADKVQEKKGNEDKMMEHADLSVAFRIPLLSKCCCNRKEVISVVVDHLLQEIIQKTSSSTHCYVTKQLLLQMYLNMPSILKEGVLLNYVLEKAEKLQGSCTKLDVISHTLLISLATTDSTKQCNERMTDLNLACRKLASAHPFLFLRQLSILAVLLQGRVHLDYSVFRSRNHQTFFVHVLGFLEVLMPHIMLQEYCEDLSKIISTYLELFQTHATQSHDLVTIFSRFLIFLQSCLAVNPTSIRPCIQRHLPGLQELPSSYLELPNYKALLAGTSWLHHNEDNKSSEINENKKQEIKKEEFQQSISSIMELWTTIRKPGGWTQTQLSPLSARLSQEGNFEDVMSALQDLENISNRKLNILEYFLDDLKLLIQNRNLYCRQLAFNLLIKHLKNKPGSASQMVTAFLQCLENHEQDVVQTALQHLPEIVILAQEYASVLLQKAFAVGISTNIHSTPQICETLLLLNVQTGS